MRIPWILFFAFTLSETVVSAPVLPAVAEHWKIELLAEDAVSRGPTAVVETPDGTIYIGQDPMDLNGPPDVPADFILRLRPQDGKLERKVFADKLWAVMGLEIIGDTLFVVHAPYLTALRDTDGDGVADDRRHLITGLGPEMPAFNGYNDHLASGIRAGMDGFLYFTFGDKGLPRAVGRDGKTITYSRGGVLRIRPDGTDMELVATGLRNPLSVALNAEDDVFAYGNDDDSKRWPNAVFHILETGHYGYPYEFRDRPHLCLPWIDGEIGGAGAQGLCFNEGGLAEKFVGDLFFAEWGRQTFIRFDIETDGGSYRLANREDIVTAGDLDTFRPFSAVSGADGNSLLLVDWAFGAKLRAGHRSGRLFRLTYHGPDRRTAAPPVDPKADTSALVGALSHSSHRERLRAQRALSARAPRSLPALLQILSQSGADPVARRHALWALDATRTAAGDAAVNHHLDAAELSLRRQAIRAAGVRRRQAAVSKLLPQLDHDDARIRRDTAIALGRIGSREAVPALLSHIDDADRFVAWAARTALQRIGHFDVESLVPEILSADASRRESFVALLEDVRDESVVEVWARVAERSDDVELRSVAYRLLAGLYYGYPIWDGYWYGTNPLIGRRPVPTQIWSRFATGRIAVSFESALQRENVEDRRAAIAALKALRGEGLPVLITQLSREKNSELRLEIVQVLAVTGDGRVPPVLGSIALESTETIETRVAAAPSAPSSFLARILEDLETPPEVLSVALAELGRRDELSEAIIERFSNSDRVELRLSALQGLGQSRIVSPRLDSWALSALDAGEPELVKAAVQAVWTRAIGGATEGLLKVLEREPELKPEITSALTASPNSAAVDVYLDGLTSPRPETRRASARALVALRDTVSEELARRVSGGAIGFAALPRVERVLTRFEPIVNWRVLGPFPRETSVDFWDSTEIDFSREYFGAGARRVSWQKRAADAKTGELDLSRVFEGFEDGGRLGFDGMNANRANVFAHAFVESPEKREALLLLGSSGSVQVWLNGKQMYRRRNWAGRAFDPEEDLLRLSLIKGKNQLLVQSHKGVGVWRFALKISSAEQKYVVEAARGDRREELRATALNYRGRPDPGIKVFFRQDGPQCGRCHVARGVGGDIGPSLMGFARKYDRAEAIRSVLEPSERLANGYTSVVVATRTGDVMTGLVRHENDTMLEIVDVEGKVHEILKSDIAQRQVSEASIMPDGLVDQLSDEDFRNLIEFLMSLDGPE